MASPKSPNAREAQYAERKFAPSRGLINDTIDAISYHFKEGNLNWPMIVYISFVHFTAALGLKAAFNVQWQTLLWAFILWPISGTGITAGVHRLWAHRSYDAHWSVRLTLMLWNSIANQGSIFHWARDHRVHHKHSETDADPHNATRGFFYAHMGWLLVKKHPDVMEAGATLDYADLKADPFVMFQKRLDPWFTLYMCYLFPGNVASYFWGEDFWSAVWVAGALRYAFVLHATWCVNSAAHLFGNHPYDPKSWPSENPFVSVVAVGEGWHNWHHKYPYDYAASEFGVDRQFNPTKMLIDFWAALGLVTKRKRATGAWMRLREERIKDVSAESKKAA